MDTIKQSAADNSAAQSEEQVGFEGFSLDEIRHRKALLAVRKEFAKARIFEQVDALKDRNPFSADGKLKAASRLGTIPMKIIKGLSYSDYILFGMTVFGTAKKIFSFFRKKK